MRLCDLLWEHGYLCDTHTAVAIKAASEKRSQHPMVVLSTASPYKFPAAVLDAIGGDTTGSEFDQMQRLSELTGVPVPSNLAGLKGRAILHTDVINREEITEYVLSKF